MDLLQSYDDDSDSDDSGDGEINKDMTDVLPAERVGSGKRELQTQNNFFSLEDSDEESKINKTLYSEPKKIQIDGLEIEVPQGSFWNNPDVSVKENNEIEDDSKVEEAKDLVLKSPNFTENSEPKMKRKKISEDGANLPLPESSPFYRTMLSEHSKKDANFDFIPEKRLAHDSHLGSKHQSHVIHREVKVEQRKIFFVHSKIAPLLNKQLKNRCPNKVEKEWLGHNQAINKIGWNNANYSHLALTVSMDTTVKIWNIWSSLDPCVHTLMVHEKAVKDGVWDPTGQKILSCGYDRSCVLSCVETGKAITRLIHEGYVFCCKYHPCNPSLVVTGSTNTLLSWDLRVPDNPVSQFSYVAKLGQIQDVLFSNHGDTIFSCGDIVSQNSADRSIMAWDFRTTGILSNQMYEERYTCNRLKLHPQDGNWFLAQSQAGYIAIFSTTRPFKMNKTKRFEGHKLLGRSIGFDISNDGDTVISGSYDKTLYCYNYKTGRQIKTLDTGLDYTDVQFHPVLPTTVLASSWDGQLQLLH